MNWQRLVGNDLASSTISIHLIISEAYMVLLLTHALWHVILSKASIPVNPTRFCEQHRRPPQEQGATEVKL
ncbi:hypothetical protein VNO77_02627 [Canavalia gladiata]|uniref:Uncharacterized protein n=1 Tax=Canavalia gladiata TaxID=3824 RepID=A0AAN9R373_CANGL